MADWTVTFQLDAPSPKSATASHAGVSLSITKGASSLEVVGVTAVDHREATAMARRVAEDFLDALARGNAALRINDRTVTAQTEGTAHASGTQRAYLQASDAGTASGEVLVEKFDAAGRLVEVRDTSDLGGVSIRHSDAARYFRAGCLSLDAFDQLRNFYLAAENIADKIRLANQRGELKEQPLLSQALAACFGADQVSLLNVAQSVPEWNSSTNLFDDVARLLFKAHRCQLNHSKATQPKKVPFNADDERAVRTVLPLVRFVAKSFMEYEEKNKL